jgi:hypothetical protein
MRNVLAITLLTAGFPLLAGDEMIRAQENMDHIRVMVESGALPRTRLLDAQDAMEAARDSVILGQTLFGSLTIEELTDAHATQMIEAATRQRDRVKKKLEGQMKLVTEGVLARSAVQPVEDDLVQAEATLRLAEQRSRLFAELAEMARSEEEAAPVAEAVVAEQPAKAAERYDGNGVFKPEDFKAIVTAYEKQFSKPLPVSAKGETEVHRAMGFDHRGRVDVALNPDQTEGVWLRRYLEHAKIPYFAFRRWLPGKATAAHIHIGPPSLPWRSAD